MHTIIRQLTTQLKDLNQLPTDIILCKVEIVVMSSPNDSDTMGNAKPTIKIQARQNAVHYTVQLNLVGYPQKKAILTFLQKEADSHHKISFGPRTGNHSFSTEQINAYLQASGDLNPLHAGPFPIVPGLLMLDWFLEQYKITYEYLLVKFQNPLYVDHDFAVLSAQNGYTLTQGNNVLMSISIDNHLKGENHETV